MLHRICNKIAFHCTLVDYNYKISRSLIISSSAMFIVLSNEADVMLWPFDVALGKTVADLCANN